MVWRQMKEEEREQVSALLTAEFGSARDMAGEIAVMVDDKVVVGVAVLQHILHVEPVLVKKEYRSLTAISNLAKYVKAKVHDLEERGAFCFTGNARVGKLLETFGFEATNWKSYRYLRRK